VDPPDPLILDPEDDDPADGDAADPVEIPWGAISPDALQGLIESFVLREGTDYGAREFSHEQKVAQVRAQLQSGEARILFDPATASVTLLPKQ
jgi:uncharacterized protein YheU (UPF0270 family)